VSFFGVASWPAEAVDGSSLLTFVPTRKRRIERAWYSWEADALAKDVGAGGLVVVGFEAHELRRSNRSDCDKARELFGGEPIRSTMHWGRRPAKTDSEFCRVLMRGRWTANVTGLSLRCLASGLVRSCGDVMDEALADTEETSLL